MTTKWDHPQTPSPISISPKIQIGQIGSLVPIRSYGHHGPAVRQGLKTHWKIPSTTSGAFRSTTRSLSRLAYIII